MHLNTKAAIAFNLAAVILGIIWPHPVIYINAFALGVFAAIALGERIEPRRRGEAALAAP